ncbi:MAG: hypothetical protein ACK5LM_03580 [Lactovum sp.]
MLVSIIKSIIIYVLEAIIKNKIFDIEELPWYKVFEKRLESLGGSIDELISEKERSIVLAQKILKDPFNSMFKNLEERVVENEGD